MPVPIHLAHSPAQLRKLALVQEKPISTHHFASHRAHFGHRNARNLRLLRLQLLVDRLVFLRAEMDLSDHHAFPEPRENAQFSRLVVVLQSEGEFVGHEIASDDSAVAERVLDQFPLRRVELHHPVCLSLPSLQVVFGGDGEGGSERADGVEGGQTAMVVVALVEAWC